MSTVNESVGLNFQEGWGYATPSTGPGVMSWTRVYGSRDGVGAQIWRVGGEESAQTTSVTNHTCQSWALSLGPDEGSSKCQKDPVTFNSAAVSASNPPAGRKPAAVMQNRELGLSGLFT